ncbi:MAG: ribose-5-phosphate isomerase [Candidatus Kerfeldbacteria bacterium CG08_land_8_20_14_0_20_43_14]|uniref:Ribose-5-phosphate isomerase n=1 Tax=Candidatus Kerfeldbacteria bacterium CG08_land_8_20_14_0_20_43_14 TaxID=2014246 RepID=A0A2H0YQK3_9BACT|nr:MAG: ribose-5-phosphate isomerase [Candidatus Kerfeldbacteria bacterium CG08_land_8_20_14_0_20_43_14]
MLVVGSDHAGFALKERIKPGLKKMGFDIEDLGPKKFDKNDDYPVFAAAVAKQVRRREGGRGILICRSGNGMAIAANKFSGIRAALAWNEKSASLASLEGNSNILVLPALFVNSARALKIIKIWLSTSFRRIPRYRRRLGQIARIENYN